MTKKKPYINDIWLFWLWASVKLPVTYQIVVGDGEQENNTITIRQSGKKDSVTLSLDEALTKFKAEVDNKTLFGK